MAVLLTLCGWWGLLILLLLLFSKMEAIGHKTPFYPNKRKSKNSNVPTCNMSFINTLKVQSFINTWCDYLPFHQTLYNYQHHKLIKGDQPCVIGLGHARTKGAKRWQITLFFFPSPLSWCSVPVLFFVCNPKLKASECFCSFHKPLRTGSGTDYEKLFLKRPYVSIESMDQKQHWTLKKKTEGSWPGLA